MLIYCSHCYGGRDSNKKRAERIITELQKKDLENTYICPLLAFGHLYGQIDESDRNELCIDLLQVCDEFLIISPRSRTVDRETEMAKRFKMPIRKHEGE